MNRRALVPLLLLASPGCHRLCGGSWAPIWVQADCLAPIEDRPDSGIDTGETDGSDTSDTGDTAGCEVALALTANGADEATVVAAGEVTLVATATNLSDHDVVLTLIEQCPNGDALFSGLEGYDWYDTCAAGVCQDTGDTFAQTLAPGAALTVQTTIDLGPSTCNAAVAAGTYELAFALPLANAQQPAICGPAPVTLTVQ